MTDEQFEKLLKVVSAGFGGINANLRILAEALVQVEHNMAMMIAVNNPAPNLHKPMAEFASFDWATINAKVIKGDDDGASAVEWNGRVFTRRSPSNKFDPAIWFSRAVGRDENGTNRYEKLITFRDVADAEELPNKVRKLTTASSNKASFNNGHPAQTAQESRQTTAQRPGASARKQETTATSSAAKPADTRPFQCQKALVTALTRKNERAGAVGISVDAWKQELRQSSLGSDDTRSFDDQQMTCALEIIEEMILEAEERAAMREQ